MSPLLRHYTTFVWLLLMLLTVSSWLLAEHVHLRAAAWLSTALLLLALFKVRLVGLHFMELRYAPWTLRLLFEVWVLVVCAAVLGIRWLAPISA